MPRVFICASGPSLTGFDFTILKNELTIGINYKFRQFTPDILVFCDSKVYTENNHKPIIDKLDCIKITKDRNRYLSNGIYALKNSKTMFYGRDGLTKGLYTSNLTGLFSLSLAIALRLEPIYLLGYDCSIEKGLHDYKDEPAKTVGRLRRYPVKNEILKQSYALRAINFEIYKDIPNIYLCGDSAIKVFPHSDINEVLKTSEPIDKSIVLADIKKKIQNARC